MIREEETKRKKPRPHKPILIAVSIIILLIAAVIIINQLVKKEETTPVDTPTEIVKPVGADKTIPEDVKAIESKAFKENVKIEIKQNQKGSWEAYYKEYNITMIYIPPGEFKMGQTKDEKKWLIDQLGKEEYNSYYKNETPLHKIYLDGYFIGKTEVTNSQYVEFLNDSKIDHKKGCQGMPCIDTDKESEYAHIKGTKEKYNVESGYEKHPVIRISWYGAVKYCEWLSDKTGLQFKLPAEAQWENAARGNDQRKYPWGSQEPDKDLANFDEYIRKTTPVGSYPSGASPYGLLDMAGNVWEWCSDRYKPGYYKNSPPKNPGGPDSGSSRVFRGGSWSDYARDLRCANRGYYGPSFRSFNLGFRLRQDI